MRVAAIYDIHGNLPALEAVLDDVRHASVDEVVVGGDVFPGPMSAEALERLQDLDVPVRFIRGNGDRNVLALAAGEPVDALPEPIRSSLEWNARRLTPEERRALEGWPATVCLGIEDLGDVVFCHGTPRSDTEIFTRLTPTGRLIPIFEHADASLVVCGHTHMQFDRTIGGVRVVNAGSVGMPFGEPGAYWLLLGPEVRLQRTRYDLDAAAQRVRSTGYPSARDFAERSILSPPSEQEMLETLTRAELK